MTMIHVGDCLEVMRSMGDNSVDAVVTDPPYGLAFMGKKWDYDVPSVEIWAECLRVLKPGGHLLAFAGTRTQHRMAVRIEDAGFEIRDMIAWVYGSGFPKSLDVSKAIDKAAGVEREVLGREKNWGASKAHDGKKAYGDYAGTWNVTAPTTEDARRWAGWGTALKPAMEPITVARKPLVGTVAANVVEFGTGAINIDGTRIGTRTASTGELVSENRAMGGGNYGRVAVGETVGRWPANLIHDGSAEVVDGFPQVQGSQPGSFQRVKTSKGLPGGGYGQETAAMREKTDLEKPGYADSGSAARFFYCAKASGKDRGDDNNHPTVKPTDLMRYLCRLVTPPGGVVLDPFMGSGSTGKAATLEGFQFVGIERDAEYATIARARIDAVAGLFPKLAGFPVQET